MRQKLFSVTKKDLKIEWFSGSGAGGQHRNKSSNCCRIKHPESGAAAQGTEQRSREQNKKVAFKRLIESVKFKQWLRMEIARCSQDSKKLEEEINDWVDKQMQDKFLRVETYGT